MVRILFGLLTLAFLGTACSEGPTSTKVTANNSATESVLYTVIPTPAEIRLTTGSFTLNAETKIVAEAKLEQEAKLLSAELADLTGLTLEVEELVTEHTSNCIVLSEPTSAFKSKQNLQNEAYRLSIKPNEGISIQARHGRGFINAFMTLLQSLESAPSKLTLRAAEVEDAPAFRHRGMLLDCCRHFMEKDFVKRYIRLLAYHKMNVLHWHLTEDQGWRIEIKKYPKLTEVGAWREDGNGGKYGGFYTQEDIKEIVAYAQQYHVTIIPEIELPGHSQAALAAYPQFSCTGGPFEVQTEWGVFKEIYCAGNDSTFTFLEDVLTEVMELFPSEYIHIGGDEAPKYRWENCPKCQRRIKEEGLKDEHELQSYFITRVEQFLNANNRRLIGWDEILEGGLSPNATVQSWRGTKGGVEAAKEGHDVIMSPTSHCYFDYDLKSIDVERVFGFDPAADLEDPAALDHILGAECNMWTERAPQETIDRKVFPRILAMAEVLWAYRPQAPFASFQTKMKAHYPRLDAQGVNYGWEKVPVTYEDSILADGALQVTLIPVVDELQLKYRLIDDQTGGLEPFLQYEQSLNINRSGETQLEVQKYRNNTRVDEETEVRNYYHHLGLGKPATLFYEYSPYYTGGGADALTDGVGGTNDFRSGHWQGLQKDDVVAMIDLKERKELSRMSAGFYQYNNAWIFLPQEVEFWVSDNGRDFIKVGTVKAPHPPTYDGQFYKVMGIDLEGVSGRYVKLVAKNIGHCPDWHDAAGSEAWLFIDEFIVQ